MRRSCAAPIWVLVAGLAGCSERASSRVSTVSSAAADCTITDGRVTCRAKTERGKALVGEAALQVQEPIPVPEAVSELVIASTGKQACAITQARQVYCWGDIVHDDVAQPQRVFPPRFVEGFTNVRQVAMTAGSVCALEGDGSVSCFGLLMGINAQPAFMAPVPIEVPPATAIAADFIQTCVIGQDGARCWGGHSAQRGKQMSLDAITLIFGTEGATALRAGDGEMCVVYPDGLEECWSTTRVPRESRSRDRN